MPLQSSGPISLNDIQNEFGGSNPISLSEYYSGGLYVSDPSIPSSGAIRLSDFYGKSAEYVVYITSNVLNVNAQSLFGAAWGSGVSKKLIVNGGVIVGGSNENDWALNFPPGMGGKLTLYNYGYIVGAGGNGGNRSSGGGARGGNAILVQSTIDILNYGVIGGGGGGGGAGSDVTVEYYIFYSCNNNVRYVDTALGGGGGGGGGFRLSSGGAGGNWGNGGGVTNGGAGGSGYTSGRATSGGGAPGGFIGYGGGWSGGAGGPAGYSIYRTSPSIPINYNRTLGGYATGLLRGLVNQNFVVNITANNFQFGGGAVGQNTYNGGYYGSVIVPQDCQAPFTPYSSGEIFVNGGSGIGFSVFVVASYTYTSSHNPNYEFVGYDYYGNPMYRISGYYCTWNYIYTIYILQNGYNYQPGDYLYFSWDGRNFAFNPIVQTS